MAGNVPLDWDLNAALSVLDQESIKGAVALWLGFLEGAAIIFGVLLIVVFAVALVPGCFGFVVRGGRTRTYGYHTYLLSLRAY